MTTRTTTVAGERCPACRHDRHIDDECREVDWDGNPLGNECGCPLIGYLVLTRGQDGHWYDDWSGEIYSLADAQANETQAIGDGHTPAIVGLHLLSDYEGQSLDPSRDVVDAEILCAEGCTATPDRVCVGGEVCPHGPTPAQHVADVTRCLALSDDTEREAYLAAEVRRLRARLADAHLGRIDAQNPGIDVAAVRAEVEERLGITGQAALAAAGGDPLEAQRAACRACDGSCGVCPYGGRFV